MNECCPVCHSDDPAERYMVYLPGGGKDSGERCEDEWHEEKPMMKPKKPKVKLKHWHFCRACHQARVACVSRICYEAHAPGKCDFCGTVNS